MSVDLEDLDKELTISERRVSLKASEISNEEKALKLIERRESLKAYEVNVKEREMLCKEKEMKMRVFETMSGEGKSSKEIQEYLDLLDRM
jgi:hypothetical protein